MISAETSMQPDSLRPEPLRPQPQQRVSAACFQHIWWIDDIRDKILGAVSKPDLAACRLVSQDFSEQAAPLLFRHISVDFRSHTFTKPARLGALQRIGHHVRTFSFSMRHGPDTFLPPLLDPRTGEEVDFIYEPHCQVGRGSADRLSMPAYGSWEMTDLLVKQYPPLFHAAANVPSFIRAFMAMPALEHLQISCPGQERVQRYRRNVVDFALISLRIAAERAKLPKLRRLSLSTVHPAAVQYLNPAMGYGTRPDSMRRWRQIEELSIRMDTIPVSARHGADHLKLLHSYLQAFSGSLQRFVFRWEGEKGFFPLSLSSEQCLSTSSPSQACPRRCHLALRPLKFAKLVFMEVENVTTDAAQVSSFILAHRRSISEFNFEGTTLRDGSWDDALAPLTRLSGSERWKQNGPEVMDVPLILSPIGLLPPVLKECRESALPARCPTPLIGSLVDLEHVRTTSKGLFTVPRQQVKRLIKGSLAAWRQF